MSILFRGTTLGSTGVMERVGSASANSKCCLTRSIRRTISPPRSWKLLPKSNKCEIRIDLFSIELELPYLNMDYWKSEQNCTESLQVYFMSPFAILYLRERRGTILSEET